MADRYYVLPLTSTSLRWDDTGNWSASSGGAPGASIPTKDDNVFIDANSADASAGHNNEISLPVGYIAECANLSINTGFGYTISSLNTDPNNNNPNLIIHGTLTINSAGGNIIINPSGNPSWISLIVLGDFSAVSGVVATRILSYGGKRIYYDPTTCTITSCPFWLKPSPNTWRTGFNYSVNDVVFDSGDYYICLVAHTSSVFATDLASVYWLLQEPGEILYRLKYYVQTPADLLGVYNCPDYDIVLVNDVDMTGQTWVPIGSEKTDLSVGDTVLSTNPFTGSFDGQGFTISNITYDDTIPSVFSGGVFGFVGSVYAYLVGYTPAFITSIQSLIQNLNFNNLNFTSSPSVYVLSGLCSNINSAIINNVNVDNLMLNGGEGGLVGTMISAPDMPSQITNCNVTNSITNNGYDAGGLIGEYIEFSTSALGVKNCKAINCSFTGYFNGAVGGLIGTIEGAGLTSKPLVNYCTTSSIDISAGNPFGEYMGGFVGVAEYYCSINNSISGSSGASIAGGFAGTISNSSVFNCSSNIDSVGTGDVASGFASYISASTIVKCFSNGTIVSSLTLTNGYGGFAGFTTGSTIHDCYSRVSLNIPNCSTVGGFIGSTNDNLINVYATGNVTGSSQVGGLVGNFGGVATNCYSVGIVGGGTQTGGLIGYCSGGINLVNCAWYTSANANAIGDDGTGNPRILLFPSYGTDEPDNTKFYYTDHPVYAEIT